MEAAWLIKRTIQRGTVSDIIAIRKYYGDKRIKEEMIQIQWLNKEIIYFFPGLKNISEEKFLTYKLLHRLT